MAEYVDFHYTPLEGRITGQQVLKQTEDAINDLGNRVYDAEVTSGEVQEALDNSQQAINIANDALAAVTTDKAVWFNNVANMKAANLVNGNVAATKGYTLYNDGNGAFYAIRQKKGGDVDDGVNIIFLDNGSVAERINEFNLIAKKNIIYVVNVAELKTSDGKIGSVYGTLGYYTANDGGAGIYTIRAMTTSDVDDGGSVISLDNGNVAELITDGTVNVKQFGAKGNANFRNYDNGEIYENVDISSASIANYIDNVTLDAVKNYASATFSNEGIYINPTDGNHYVDENFTIPAPYYNNIADKWYATATFSGKANVCIDGVWYSGASFSTIATDDTSAIQKAINFANNVVFNDMCKISSPLQFHSNTVLTGNGSGGLAFGLLTLISKTMLKPVAGEVQNILIENITFDQNGVFYGNNGSSQCISVNGCKNVTIRHNVFRNVMTMAVWFDDKTTLSTENINILNNVVENSAAGGFSLFGYCKGLHICGNHLSNTSDDAIALQYNSGENTYYIEDAIIDGNIIKDLKRIGSSRATARGILVFGAKDVSITNNMVEKTYSCNVRVQGCKDVIIAHNVCKKSGRKNDSQSGVPLEGIRVDAASENVTITDNLIIDNSSVAIHCMGNSKNINVSNNTIINSTSHGVHFSNISDGLITYNMIGNRSVSLQGSAIYLEATCTHIGIIGNKIVGNNTYRGIVTQANTSDILFTNNDMSNATQSNSWAGTDITSRSNINAGGNPLTVDYVASSGDKNVRITGVSCDSRSRAVVTAVDDNGATWLAGGYRLSTESNAVTLYTINSAVTGSTVRVSIL